MGHRADNQTVPSSPGLDRWADINTKYGCRSRQVEEGSMSSGCLCQSSTFICVCVLAGVHIFYVFCLYVFKLKNVILTKMLLH